tara:strand:- start:1087 stop:1722 length:636 start_codon:yes stop_codon:yes gene_type:complete
MSSYIPKDGVTQAFRDNKGVLSPNQIIDLDNQNKYTKFGQIELIGETSLSGAAASIDFDNIQEDVYNVHILHALNLAPANDNQQVGLRFKVNGSVDSDNDYHRAVFTIAGDGGVDDSRDTAINSMMLTFNQGNATNEKGHAIFHMYNLGAFDKVSYINMRSVNQNNGNTLKAQFGAYCYDVTAAVDGLSFIMTNGSNIATGTFRLYGVRFA